MGQVNVDRRPTPPRQAASLSGHLRVAPATLRFSSSYPTGGEACDLGDASSTLDSELIVQADPVDGYTFEYDYAARKMRALLAGVEVADTTDLSAVTVNVLTIARRI